METPTLPPVPTTSVEFVHPYELRLHAIRFMTERITNISLPEDAVSQEYQFQFNDDVHARVNGLDARLQFRGLQFSHDISSELNDSRCKVQLASWEDGMMEWMMWVEVDLRTLEVFDFETLPPAN